MMPRTLKKRADIESIGRIDPAQRRKLIFSNRLSLPALFGIVRGTEVAP